MSEPEPGKPRMRLPLLSTGAPIGLGDALKRATSALGVPPCGGCARRAQALNRIVIFTPRR